MKLSDLHLDIELYYKLYSAGSVQEKIRLARVEHRYPIGAADFVNRLEQVTAYPLQYENWNNACPTLGDAIIRLPTYPLGSVRIIRGNSALWNFASNRNLRDGVIQLQGSEYERFDSLLIPGIMMRRYPEKKQKLEKEIFSYLGLGRDQAAGKRVCFPKAREYPYLTLLAFSSSAKILGSSLLNENTNLIGIKEDYPDWVSIWLEST